MNETESKVFEADRVVVVTGEPEVVMTPSESGRGRKVLHRPSCHVALWSNYAGGGDLVHFVRVGTLLELQRITPAERKSKHALDKLTMRYYFTDIMSDLKHTTSPLHVDPQPVPKVGKSERTRAAILNAALDFVWSHPFRDMTVGTLMESAGASRSAFYQYFGDLHEVMETLLTMLQQEIFTAVEPWLAGVGDPVALTQETLTGLVDVCYERGPFLRAITDAAATDPRLEEAWVQFLGGFDDAATARIETDQEQGLIPDFEARPVAFAINRLDAYTLIQAFGQHPRKEPGPVREALARIWISTFYGAEWLDKRSSDLVRR